MIYVAPPPPPPPKGNRPRKTRWTESFTPPVVVDKITHKPTIGEPPWKILFMSSFWVRGGLEAITLNYINNLNQDIFRPALLVGDVLEMQGSLPPGMEFVQNKRCFELNIPANPKDNCPELQNAIRESTEVIKRIHPDIVVGEVVHGAMFGARNALVPLIIDYCHGGLFWDKMEHPCDCIIAVSKNVIKNMIANGRKVDNARIIYNGVDSGLFHVEQSWRDTIRDKYKLLSGNKLIGICGRVAPEKNVESWIDLVKKCGATGMIIGSKTCPNYWSKVKAKIIKSNLVLDKDIIHASVSHNEVPKYLNALDILVHMSRIEPFGLVIIEALLCGKPVVAFDSDGPAEIWEMIGPDCGLFLVKNEDEMADMVSSVLEQKPQVNRDKVASIFSLDSMINNFQSLVFEYVSELSA